jgi:hypothetical protein
VQSSLSFDKNWVELKDFNGMNIVKNHFLFCHYSQEKDEKIMKIINKENLMPAILLPETQGMLITDKGTTLIGKGQAWVVTSLGKKEFDLK